MKTIRWFIYISFLLPSLLYGQTFQNDFDGTNPQSLPIEIGTETTNIWQIGMPQKTIFNSAATQPNALLTDTLNYIPNNNTSSFEYKFWVYFQWTIVGFQWKQKLDLDHGKDFGNLEFSVDDGLTWQSAFDNPYVYDIYGHDDSNLDTLPTGEIYFTGTDAAWRDIWFCMDANWLSFQDTLRVRHTIISDSIDNNNEGWMLDNLVVHNTLIHTNSEVRQDNYIIAAPNPTTGRVHITTRKSQGFHIIEKMELSDAAGKLLRQWENIPTKFFVDLDEFPNGVYFLNIKTNKDSETVKLVLQK